MSSDMTIDNELEYMDGKKKLLYKKTCRLEGISTATRRIVEYKYKKYKVFHFHILVKKGV